MDVTAGQDGFLAGRDQNIDNRVIHLAAGAIPHPSEVEVQGPVHWTPRPPVRVFKGRADALRVLETALGARGGAVVTQAIYGLGGIGKSELALQFEKARRADYRLTWWITAVDPSQIEAGLASLAGRLCPQVPLAGTTSDAAAWAIGWLQAHDRWLLILDNVEDPADIEPLLGQVGGGHVIVTTRIDADWSRIADPLRLDLLKPGPALELLSARTTRHAAGDLAALAEVARELGYLPLALSQAAAYMTAQRIAPATYLDRLRQQPAKLYAADLHGDAQRTIGRLWDVHISALKAASPAALSLLNVLAWYAPDAIPRVILGGAAPREETDDSLAVLARYSLIILTDDRVGIHRLLQAVVLSKTEMASQDIALQWLADALPDDPERNAAGWPLLRSLTPHAEALGNRYQSSKRPERLGLVQNHVAIFLGVQGDAARAVPLSESALAICESVVEPDVRTTARRLITLANLYREAGRVADALALCERALGITEAALGPDHLDTARRLGNLADIYIYLGRLEDALPLCERAVRIMEAELGPDHPEMAVRLGSLAVTYHRVGRAADGLPLSQRALRLAEAVFGPHHPYTAAFLGQLGSIYRGVDRAADAAPLMERALRITEAALGPDHPTTAIRLSNLAATYRSLGRAGDAIPLEERAAEIRRRD